LRKCLADSIFLLPVLACACAAADFSLLIPAIRTSLPIADQSVTAIVSGHVSGRGQVVAIQAEADLANLQEKITPILSALLNQDNRCGDRLSVERGALDPDAPSGMLTANLHYEKWGCAKAFGKEMVKRLVGGDAVVKVRLTPVVDTPDAVHLGAEVISIDATGQLGEILRSGSFGAALQEKIRKKLTAELEKSANLKAALPPAVQDIAAIRSAAFADAGAGRLRLAVAGEIQVSGEQAAAIAERLKSLDRR
jgi:hypothetical protein